VGAIEQAQIALNPGERLVTSDLVGLNLSHVAVIVAGSIHPKPELAELLA
jgi:hypothetical protein